MAGRTTNRNRNSSRVTTSSKTKSDSDSQDGEEAELDEEEELDSDSQDEYQPPIKPSNSNQNPKKSRLLDKGKRKRLQESDEEDDDDLDQDQILELDSDGEEISSNSKKSKKKSKKSSSKVFKNPTSKNQWKSKSEVIGSDDDLVSEEDQPDFYAEELAAMERLDPEEELQDKLRAEDAWALVKAKKQGLPPPTPKALPPKPIEEPATTASNTLTSWLGLPNEDSLPWPTSCKEAQIQDRDSTFIGYVYPITKPNDVNLTLNHLTKKVHPTIPFELLPVQFRNVPNNKRGSSHDMFAFSVLVLKRGRDGKDGPEDWTIKDGKEDDGEKWGGDRIERVIKQEGGSDLICIVSRWYGGTMLGPDRFQHIENVARAAIRQFMLNEAVIPLRQELLELDQKILDLKKKLGQDIESPSKQRNQVYQDLTLEKAEKLVKARKGTLGFLEKKLGAAGKEVG